MSPFALQDLKAIASPELSVVTRDGDEPELFADAIASRAYTSRGVTAEEGAKWPEAVLAARSVEGVQQAVRFCADHELRVCVRSGGHSWHPGHWLRGDNTVLLDVGELNSIDVDEIAGTVSAGPGAKGDEVLKALPDGLFFPCGHCPGVPLGGFVLGGGYGLGFPKYGLTSTLVQAVDVVLGTGEAMTASVDSQDPREQAICSLLSGSYTGFPGVITKYHFKKLPPHPQGILSGFAMFDLRNDWKKAVKLALDIQFRGDDDALAIETAVVFTYAPPPIAEATGVSLVAIVHPVVYADTEQEGRDLWNKYVAEVKDTLVPIEEPKLVAAETIPDMFGAFYPAKARNEVRGNLGNELLYAMSDEEIAAMVEPVVDMWLSDDKAPPPSHTLFVPIHPALKSQTHGGKELTIGFTPSLVVISYAIYQDASLDSRYMAQLRAAHQLMDDSPAFRTETAEGNVSMLGAASCFTKAAFEEVQQKIALLDPSGVFAGFPQQAK